MGTKKTAYGKILGYCLTLLLLFACGGSDKLVYSHIDRIEHGKYEEQVIRKDSSYYYKTRIGSYFSDEENIYYNAIGHITIISQGRILGRGIDSVYVLYDDGYLFRDRIKEVYREGYKKGKRAGKVKISFNSIVTSFLVGVAITGIIL